MNLPRAVALYFVWPGRLLLVVSVFVVQVSCLWSAEEFVRPPVPVERALYHPVITIAGTCRSEQTAPVADAEVRLYARYANREQEELLITVRTDADGEFNLGRFAKPGLPGVHYGPIGKGGVPLVPISLHVVILKKGLATAGFTLPRNRPHELEAVMPPGATLKGRVVGPDERPVAGAQVRPAGYGGRGGILTTTTDKDGRFAISDLAPLDNPPSPNPKKLAPVTRLGLVVEHPKFGIKQAFYARCPATLNLRLEAPGVVKGSVVDADGQPAAGVKVWSRSTQGDLRHGRLGMATATTDEQGAYRMLLQGAREVRIGVYEERFPLFDKRRRQVLIDRLEVNPGRIHEVPQLQLLHDNQIFDGE